MRRCQQKDEDDREGDGQDDENAYEAAMQRKREEIAEKERIDPAK